LPAALSSAFQGFARLPQVFFSRLRWGHRSPETLKIPLCLRHCMDSWIIACYGVPWVILTLM